MILPAGPEPSAQCELSAVNASHPVQALMESFTVLSGCASRGTTGLPQEVHVLNLRGPDPGPGQPQREVGTGTSFLPMSRGSFSSIHGLTRMILCEHMWGVGSNVHAREKDFS